jgi:metallo-beta-lactamase family protein
VISKSITITHLGAEACVTGSCHLIRFQPDHSGCSIAILVDCGIAQGHAHIDHIGRVPDLIDAGFSGEVICTQGTKALKNLANDTLNAYYCYKNPPNQKYKL